MTRKAGLAALAAVLVVLISGSAAYYVIFLRPTFDPERIEKYYAALSVPPATAPDESDVRAAIARSAAYLRRTNSESGQFVYLVNMNPDVVVPPGYNLLRHAGAVYSLGMAERVVPDPSNQVVMHRAVEFMRSCCMTRFEDPDMIGIWEPKEIVHEGERPRYKLGGAGLALIAMTSLAQLDAGAVPTAEMAGLAEFGRFLQRWNGEFFALYVPTKGGRSMPGKSLYYPGEMALGWLRLYELHGDPRWLDSAVKALRFLARQRAVSGEAPADHWALLATAKLFELARRDGLEVPQGQLFDHAVQICHAILDEAPVGQSLQETEGALVVNGIVTPTATRLEGLLAARSFLPDDHPITPHVDSAVRRGIGFLLRAQVKGGLFDGGMPFAIAKLPQDGSVATVVFNSQTDEIRVDYVQHAMSALVQFLESADRPMP